MNIRGGYMIAASAAVGAVAVGAAAALQGCAGGDERPNVLLILTDDIGYGDIAALGNNIIQTPNLDRLHSQSVSFSQYHASPTSSPTRAALMTGRHNDNTGVWHTVNGRSLILERETTMAEIFRDNGYATAIMGKWHLGDNYPFRPEDRGFEEVLMIQGGGAGQTMDYWDNDYFNDFYTLKDGERVQIEGYCNDVWFGGAKRFIAQSKSERRPFFCYLATNIAHSPYWVADEYTEPYKGVDNVAHAAFYGMIANVDEHVGDLTEYLKSIGMLDNTIIIFTTDNGTAQGAKVEGHRLDGFVSKGQNAGMRGIKASMYEGGHRVPLFIHWKDGKLSKAREVTELVAHYDILPTLIEMCGLDVPESVSERFDGESLVGLIGGDDSAFKGRTVVVDSNRNEQPVKWFRTAVMQGPWRLVSDEPAADGSVVKELYDLSVDPEQRHDIAAQHPAKVAELVAEYDAWWAKNSPNFPEEPYFIIGNDAENPSTLFCHDWHTTKTSPWQQNHIRTGYVDNGYWSVRVDRAGKYRFRLRRWPAETGLRIHDEAPERPAVAGTSVTKSVKGRSLPIYEARISVQGVERVCSVQEGDEYAEFVLELEGGETRLQTWFKQRGKADIGAYFVEIERL